MAFNSAVVLQKRGQNSSSAAPANFTASFAGATTAGSLVIALVATANSAAATVSTPASFVAGQTAGNTAIGVYLFYQYNAASLTNVVFGTLTNVNGIAVILYEVSNVPATGKPDGSANAVGANVSASAASVASASYTPQMGNGVIVGIIASLVGQSLTGANIPAAGIGAFDTGTFATSTTGATNVQAQGYVSQPGPVYPTGGVLQVGGTNGAANACGALLAAFPSLASGALTNANDAGASGVTSGGAGYAVGG